VNMAFPTKITRFFALLCLLASLGVFAKQAAAATTETRIYGPWVVVKTPTMENVGMRVFFSPDGNFFMVDPTTMMGYAGNWEVGRSGLLVSIYGNGRWAKLWDADVSFDGKNRMTVDVKESQFAKPHRVILERLKF
jgi:hypothetical protein